MDWFQKASLLLGRDRRLCFCFILNLDFPCMLMSLKWYCNFYGENLMNCFEDGRGAI